MMQTPYSRPAGGSRQLAFAVKTLTISMLLATLAACHQGENSQQQAAANSKPQALPVGVVIAERKPIGISQNLPGRVEASRVAQIRARAAGILEKRLFREGSDVKAGQRLFLIDPAPLRATYNSANASLARAQTNERLSAQTVARYTPLLKANAISRQNYDNAVSAQKQAAADVAVARAAVKTAQINLSYAAVTSPISGRIGRAQVTEGALVGQGEATILATVQQIDPVYVNITQPASAVMKLKNGLGSGRLKPAGTAEGEAASVRIRYEDGTAYPQKGSLLFTDLTVDEGTGQVTLRAEVPNPDGALLPGMYVRAELEQAEIPDAILIPQQAVTRTATGDTLVVVDDKGAMSQRTVKISGSNGQNWVITEGLRQGEKVMVDGFQLVQMLHVQQVIPVPWKPGDKPVAGSQPTQPAADSKSAAQH